MARLTLSIFDPIEIVIGKQKFVVERISSKLLGELQTVVEGMSDPTKIKADALAEVLMKAIPGMTKEVAMEVDIRHVPMIVQFLAEQINAALEPPKAGELKN